MASHEWWYNSGDALKWYGDAIQLLEGYRASIDRHWAAYQAAAAVRPSVSADDFLDELHIRQQKPAIEQTQNLLRVVAMMPRYSLQPLLPRFDSKSEREQISLVMHIKLGMWLCTYFHGIARLDLWEETVELSRRLGAFPGDAFFYKSAGDIYRLERRRLIGDIPHNPADRRTTEQAVSVPAGKNVPPGQGVIVMSLTAPIALLDDELDLIPTARAIYLKGFVPPDATPDNARKLFDFLRAVNRLAHRYLRFQTARYTSCRSGHSNLLLPLSYGVACHPLRTRLEDLAADIVTLLDTKFINSFSPEAEIQKKTKKEITQQVIDEALGASPADQPSLIHELLLKLAESGAVEEFLFQRRWLPASATGSTPGETTKPTVKEQRIAGRKKSSEYAAVLTYLKHRSDELARLFFAESSPSRKLVVFDDEDNYLSKGVASVVGRSAGVAAQTFDPASHWTRCCYWINGLLLAAERDRLRRIWGRTHKFEYNPNESQPFSSKWFKDSPLPVDDVPTDDPSVVL